MSIYFFLLILMIIIVGLYYIKSFNKTPLGLISLMVLVTLVAFCVMKGIIKLNLFVVEPWRLFVITFMGVLCYIISKERTQSDFEETILVLVTPQLEILPRRLAARVGRLSYLSEGPHYPQKKNYI